MSSSVTAARTAHQEDVSTSRTDTQNELLCRCGDQALGAAAGGGDDDDAGSALCSLIVAGGAPGAGGQPGGSSCTKGPGGDLRRPPMGERPWRCAVGVQRWWRTAAEAARNVG